MDSRTMVGFLKDSLETKSIGYIGSRKTQVESYRLKFEAHLGPPKAQPRHGHYSRCTTDMVLC